MIYKPNDLVLVAISQYGIADLAKEIGVSAEQVRRWRRGAPVVKFADVKALCDLTGYNIEEVDIE